jgi:hypothetical protein
MKPRKRHAEVGRSDTESTPRIHKLSSLDLAKYKPTPYWKMFQIKVVDPYCGMYAREVDVTRLRKRRY